MLVRMSLTPSVITVRRGIGFGVLSLMLPSHPSLRAPRRFHGGWIAARSEARLRLLKTTQPGDDDVARSSFRRTDRYPHAVWRNFCVIGTEPFDMAGDLAVAGQ